MLIFTRLLSLSSDIQTTFRFCRDPARSHVRRRSLAGRPAAEPSAARRGPGCILKVAARRAGRPPHTIPQPAPRHTCRMHTYARSKLVISEGAAYIKWKTEATKRLSKEIKEKQAHAEASGVTWARENDVLTQCLGPEQPGRVRGVSSYNGWKEAWPRHLGMYIKRRKISSADLRTIKDELRA